MTWLSGMPSAPCLKYASTSWRLMSSSFNQHPYDWSIYPL
jgi:hypothetical protein